MGEPNPLVVERRATLRRATLQLFVGVLAVHGVALALYYGFDVAHRANQTRTIFVVAWTFVTAITVAYLLRRVRLARRMTVLPLKRKA